MTAVRKRFSESIAKVSASGCPESGHPNSPLNETIDAIAEPWWWPQRLLGGRHLTSHGIRPQDTKGVERMGTRLENFQTVDMYTSSISDKIIAQSDSK